MTNNTIIALFYYIDDSEFVTVEDLLHRIAAGYTTYTMADYTDRRKSTNITEKIDWKLLRKKYNS